MIYCSFDLMLLGNNKVYNCYDLYTDNVELNLHRISLNFDSFSEPFKKFTNDLLFSLVLSSSVKEVCAMEGINNIFIESIK